MHWHIVAAALFASTATRIWICGVHCDANAILCVHIGVYVDMVFVAFAIIRPMLCIAQTKKQI